MYILVILTTIMSKYSQCAYSVQQTELASIMGVLKYKKGSHS